MHESVTLPPLCNLRPARSLDVAAIARLTRQLNRTACPASKWHRWLAIGLGAIGVVFAGYYPGVLMTVILSTAPLWMMILLVFLIAKQEQKRQWQKYFVVEYQGMLVACGRIDHQEQHSEIYDVFVLPEWRSQGLGQAIVQALLQQAIYPVYLASLPGAVPFYQAIGFESIEPQKLSMFVASRLSLSSPRYRQVRLQPMVLRSSLR
jgi:N-acetylglutamate synthase-like GNAT family acetyltransferase